MFSRFRSNTQPSPSRPTLPTKAPIPPPHAIKSDHVDHIDASLELENDLDDLLLQPQPARLTVLSHRHSSYADEFDCENFSRPIRRSRVLSLQADLLSPPSSTTRIFSQPTQPALSTSAEERSKSKSPPPSDSKDQRPQRASRLDSWFKGVSEPVTLGFPLKEEVSVEETDLSDQSFSLPTVPPNKLKKKAEMPVTKIASQTSSRFSFFNSSAKIKPNSIQHDDILALKIPTVLKESSNEVTDPYAALLSTATTLLTRTQNAYKERSTALQDLELEYSAQKDELEEAETRAQHLKMQLATLASKLDEQESAMQEMAADLASERQRRREEQAARKRSIALVKPPPEVQYQLAERQGRGSFIFPDTPTDSDSEDDTNSSASVFSRPSTSGRDSAPSPTSTVTSAFASDLSDMSEAAYVQAVAQTIVPFRISEARPPLSRQPSVFQRCLDDVNLKDVVLRECVQDTSNNGNDDVAMNLGLITQLRREKDVLAVRCQDLERTVEETLKLVGGL